MKKRGSSFGFLLGVTMWLAGLFPGSAASIVWTNLSGGNWSETNSWSPNAVPSTNDDAFITNSGTYEVSLDISAAVNSLTVGGSNGTQTLHTGTSVLTVNGASDINTNAVFDLEGGSFYGPGSMFVSGTFVWTGGYIGGGGPTAAVSVAPNGTMLLEGQSYNLYGIITNAGSVTFSGGSLAMFGACYSTYGMFINLSNGVVTLQSDANIQALCGTEVITNYGRFVKYGAPLSPIAAPFYNHGLLDVESGTVSLADVYDLTNGTLNFGIGSTNDFGSLFLNGSPAQLAGAVTATLDGTYQPIATNVFPVITYASFTNLFTSTNLPYLDAWATNYTSTTFSLVVLNARPMIAQVPKQNIPELVPWSFSANATDADLPPQTLTFSLSNAPAGMTIGPSSGLLTWTPAQNESPSTNFVTVIVTDNGTPPLSTNTTFRIVVREVNEAPVLPVIGLQTVNDLSLLTVTNTATESNIHATITGYALLNPPAGAAISPTGVITWTPSPSEGPSTNTITTIVTNSDPLDLVNPKLTSINSFSVIVFSPSLAPMPDLTIDLGQTLTVTNIAYDNDPTRTLTFSLSNAPAGASIGSATGVFVWRPGFDFVGTTNTVTVRVTDNNAPPLSATGSFTVFVAAANGAVLGEMEFSNGQFQFQVDGPLGPIYSIEASTNLSSGWTNLQTLTPAAMPFVFTDTNAIFPRRFYRVQLSQ